MNKLFFQMSCLSESNEIKSQDIYERLFDKKVDKRYLESSIQKFLLLNKKMFSFIGIDLEMNGTGSDFSIKFKSSNYIGAIPIRMPYDGISHKDFQIIPRFDNSNHAFSDLTQLLSKLDYSVSPEYSDGEELSLPLQLRPPIYYEATKYIELFEQAQKQNWVKFEIQKSTHSFPKSNTDWSKHANHTSNPVKALQFPSSDSILSRNHSEWQELTYVFEIAQSIILQQNVPESIRYKYQNRLIALRKKNTSIKAKKTNNLVIHASDPPIIKEVKRQANMLIKKGSTTCVAWRIDMAQLFEKYIQHIVNKSITNLGGTVSPNKKILGKGSIPPWGLKYLEPDLIVNFNSMILMADAKYKSHYYAFGQNSEVLKVTHRSDLHQLLAYCSFSPQNNKTGILFYPSSMPSYKKIDYIEQLGGITNTIYIFGVPFGINEMDKSINKMKDLFSKILV
ncbi:MAG: hypothetical protein E7517_01635 [Ruminococcaceae bacterium]|nr:hypothetical protein [Oscillospiraceae bacterium]